MQQNMVIAALLLVQVAFSAPMSDFKPAILFEDDLNRQSIEFTETQTTAVPDLPEFLFKQFGHPPLTDNQILALLIGSTAIPEELMTRPIVPTEETSAAMADEDILSATNHDEKAHNIEAELIEQAKEIEERLAKDVQDLRRIEQKVEENKRMNSGAVHLTSSFGVLIALILAML